MEKNAQILLEKWAPVLEHDGLPSISNRSRAVVTAQVLENTEDAVAEERQQLHESSVSSSGGTYAANAGFGNNTANSTGRAGYDPVLISMVRRSVPMMMAFDICGVQAMNAPTGLIFALKSRYTSQAPTATNEALFNEANYNFGGSAFNDPAADEAPTHSAGTNAPDSPAAPEADPFAAPVEGATPGFGNDAGDAVDPAYAVGPGTAGPGQTSTGMTTREGEGDNFREMSFSIEKTAVVARTRALKAEYTMELVQDLRAVHGLDAEAELSNILSTEILAEINREVVHTVNTQAKFGAQNTTVPGVFDAIADGQGRWSVERIKGLMLQIEREANQISFETRRGKGNIVICSANVASALTMAGLLDYSSAIQDNLSVDVTQSTYAGILNGRFKVYVDPFAVSTDYVTVGYKGSNEMDAGVFYCPYVPVQTLRATAQETFQPKIGMKTRYGMVSNPFANGTVQTEGLVADHTNTYYRIMRVDNI